MSNSIIPKKSLGQHWLSDSNILDSIIESSDLESGQTVIEVGPGLGYLTDKLLDRGAKVIAIEFDEVLYDRLRFKALPNLEVVNQDILKFNFLEVTEDYKVVANIPYYLTSNLLRILSDTDNKPEVAVLLVQKEVAERVVAGPGKMSILSIAAQISYKASLGIEVPAKFFTPPPKVDSQVLVLSRLEASLIDGLDRQKFFRLVKAGFGEKRKKLRSSLSGGLQMDKTSTDKAIVDAGLSPDSRAQDLSIDDWVKLYKVLFLDN